MAKRALLATRDLLFRAKLGAVVTVAGGQVTKDEAACDLVVLEIGTPGIEARVRALVGRGIPVLAFGSHVNVAGLRAAREAGAVAVPNSQVEATVGDMVRGGGEAARSGSGN